MLYYYMAETLYPLANFHTSFLPSNFPLAIPGSKRIRFARNGAREFCNLVFK